MKHGFLAKEGFSKSIVGEKLKCQTFKKVVTCNKSKEIYSFSSKGLLARIKLWLIQPILGKKELIKQILKT